MGSKPVAQMTPEQLARSRDARRAEYQRNRDSYLLRAEKWAKDNPERRRQASRTWAENNRDYHLRRKYGIGEAEYDRLHDSQDGRCAICREPETATYASEIRRLCVDHCHTSGAVRGLLCSACNTSIGLLREDPARLEAAAEYLRRHS